MNDQKLTGLASVDKPWLKYYSEEAINTPMQECTIYEYLWKNNKDHQNDIAINYYDNKISYGSLFSNIEKTAKSFSKLGVKKGDNVVICSVNTPETVYAVYALNRLGAIANMVDPRTSVSGVQDYIKETETKIVLTIEAAYPLFAKIALNTEIKKIISVSPADSLPWFKAFIYRLKQKAPELGENAVSWNTFLSLGSDATPDYIPYEKNTCCVIAHTGGTTGTPKGVMLTNDNINAVTFGYRYTGIPFMRQQKYFNDLPPFIMYGLCLGTHTVLSYGLEMILYPVFDSKKLPEQFAKYKPQHFSAVSDHLQYLMSDKKIQKMDLSFLITPAVGGDSLDQKLEMKRISS